MNMQSYMNLNRSTEYPEPAFMLHVEQNYNQSDEADEADEADDPNIDNTDTLSQEAFNKFLRRN